MNDYFIADDLSGALDAAAAFHRCGEAVTIVLSRAAWTPALRGRVVGTTTESRNAEPAMAAAAVAEAIAHGRALGETLLYKKIDSTLRGAVAAEVAALQAAWPGVRVLFAPANPAVGRTVRDGVLHVHGVPVAETEFGRDPLSPVRESRIRRLLGAAATERVVIPDVSTPEDLSRAVAAMDALGTEWVGVGSGALARPVAERRRLKRGLGRNGEGVSVVGGPGVASTGTARPMLAPGPALMICGSAHAGNRAQAQVLAQERGVPAFELRCDQPAEAMAAVRAVLSRGVGASVLIEERRRESAAVLRRVADVATALLAESGLTRVFVTGGETAFALGAALGVAELEFHAEVEPGLSVSFAAAPRFSGWFAIKPGGFGDRATWVRAWDALQAAR